MRVTSKGQVTIPQKQRERYGLLPGAEVEFVDDGKTLRLRRKRGGGRGQRLVEHMRGRGTLRLSTDEILALTRGER